MGRNGRQLQVSGQLVVPEELERALQRHPAVRLAAIVPRAGVAATELDAYIEFMPAQVVGGAELRAHLATLLPGRPVPSTWSVVEAMPLTPTGEVDWQALTEHADHRAGGDSGAPTTPLQQYLVQVWQEALQCRALSIHDDFSELGGTSIRAVLAAHIIQEFLGDDVDLTGAGAPTTVACLADYLEQHYGAIIRGRFS